jgi:Protein of unknown function (DUF2894)
MFAGLLKIEKDMQELSSSCHQGREAFLFRRMTAILNKSKTRSDKVQQQLALKLQELYAQLKVQLDLKAVDNSSAVDAVSPAEKSGSESHAGADMFRSLVSRINEFDVSELEKASLGLDALLFDELGSTDASVNEANAEGSNVAIKERAKELRSLQHYREQLGKVITENMVRQVIQEDPENAGPLNPQRLLVRTIGAMKDISPAYVNRLVPYYDSLLWLEQAGGMIDNEA